MDDLSFLGRVLLEKTGIAIGGYERGLSMHRLHAFAEECSMSYDEMALKVASERNPEFLDRVLACVTNHETKFFRDTGMFEELADEVLPDFVRRNGTLSIWSAACSTGQEIYSIAMLLNERFGGLNGRAHLLGTDISPGALEYARRGLYNEFELSRGLRTDRRARYFQPLEGGGRVIESLRNMVEFRPCNLVQSLPAGSFDIIFCRNVLCYFDTEVRETVLDRLSRLLRGHGILALGSSEFLPANDSGLLRAGRSNFYRVNPGLMSSGS